MYSSAVQCTCITRPTPGNPRCPVHHLRGTKEKHLAASLGINLQDAAGSRLTARAQAYGLTAFSRPGLSAYSLTTEIRITGSTQYSIVDTLPSGTVTRNRIIETVSSEALSLANQPWSHIYMVDGCKRRSLREHRPPEQMSSLACNFNKRYSERVIFWSSPLARPSSASE